jgi:hypothetical protein
MANLGSAESLYATISDEQAKAILSGTKDLSSEFAERVLRDAERGVCIASPNTISSLIDGFSTTELIDPYDVTFALARSSAAVATILAAKTGGVERYRIFSHTQAVLGQSASQLAVSKPFDADDMRIITSVLTLQDIGKPIGNTLTDSRAQQSRFNTTIATSILSGVSSEVLPEDEKQLVVALLGHDAVGGAILGRNSIEEARHQLDGVRAVAPGKYRDKLSVFFKHIYLADATAYTSRAEYRTVDGKRKHCLPTLNLFFKQSSTEIVPRFKKQRQVFEELIGA